ncbi:MAG TPA: sodium:proton antiporter, partial [Ilumatobacteraceae bacterium]|nr:sodium:proton antiporter [Ilumatobacteraceae bacterium]
MTWVIVGILVGGVFAHWTAWRLRIPVIVFLLAGGLVAGPITGTLDPDGTFGTSLFPLVSIAVAIVLFEGALGLGWKGVQEAGRTVWMLLTVGAAVTLVGTAVAARYVLKTNWDLAILISCVLVVTGPTVVGPLVASLGLRGRLGSILIAEGTLIDPIGAILTVLAFRALFEAQTSAELFRILGSTIVVGMAIGIAAAIILTVILGRYILPDELHTVATLAMVVTAFAAANHFADEAGLISVTVMGVIMARQQMAPVQRILEFNHALRILLISGLFILLGARIEPQTLRSLEWRNVVFLAAMVVVIRPLAVALSTVRSGLGKRDRLFLAATAPRGIVAAAIASVFALKLADNGHQNSQLLVSAVFTVIAGTVVLSGFGGRPLAKKLGILGGERKTMVLLGASP